MNNYYLTKEFQLETLTQSIKKDKTGNPIAILNDAYKGNWSYSIKAINPSPFYEGLILSHVTVYLYGTVRDGIGEDKTIESSIANAISNVLKTLLPEQKVQKESTEKIIEKVTKSTKVNPVKEEVTEKEITEVIMNNPKLEEAVTTVLNETDKATELKVVDLTPPAPEVKETLVQTTTQTPDPAPQVLSKETIEKRINQAMLKFKISVEDATKINDIYMKYGINKMSMLLKYLKAWNNSIEKVEDLNNTNVKSFIEWANNTPKFDPIEEGV